MLTTIPSKLCTHNSCIYIAEGLSIVKFVTVTRPFQELDKIDSKIVPLVLQSSIIIADCSPLTAVINFHSPFILIWAAHQPHRALCPLPVATLQPKINNTF